jgi:8-oxo-dGTP pyrophosphatase MutT (NUDIX family)
LTIQATLCFIVKEDKVLLLKKSKGLLGERKWNALGGKMLPGETPAECVVRETLEETSLAVASPERHCTTPSNRSEISGMASFTSTRARQTLG